MMDQNLLDGKKKKETNARIIEKAVINFLTMLTFLAQEEQIQVFIPKVVHLN